jgi:hypothetical protein
VRGWLWRAKLKSFAAGLGVTSEETFAKWVRATHGARWAYRQHLAIMASPIAVYPTARHALDDGQWIPEEHRNGTDYVFGEPVLVRSRPVDD